MGFHVCDCLLPLFSGVRVFGTLERCQEVESSLLFLFTVTVRTVGLDEWGDFLAEGFFGIGLKRGEILVIVYRLCLAREGQ